MMTAYAPAISDPVISTLLVGKWKVTYVNPLNGNVNLLNSDGDYVTLANADTLTRVTRVTRVAPALPPEPPVGSGVYVDGKLWLRTYDGDYGYWWQRGKSCAWSEIADRAVPAIPLPNPNDGDLVAVVASKSGTQSSDIRDVFDALAKIHGANQ